MKTFKRFEVIKMADLLGAEGAVCHGRNEGNGRQEAFSGLSILHFKTKQNKIQEELEGSQPNAVIS